MRSRALLAPLAIAAGLLATSPAARAAEEETHVFSAALSLTGGCGTSTLDPIPDPGPCPGTAGVDHPSEPFLLPKAVAVDKYGDRYVASYGLEFAEPNEGRIDVFGPDGKFITEIADPHGPSSVAVDSLGNLYVFERHTGGKNRVVRFSPTTYQPQSGQIAYPAVPVLVSEGYTYYVHQPFGEELKESDLGIASRIAIDLTDDHLFADAESVILEFGSAAEGNPLLDNNIGEGQLSRGAATHVNGTSGSVAIDAAHGRIYADRHDPEEGGTVVRVFELAAPHALLATLDGSSVPAGKFESENEHTTALAVEESSGRLFVADFGAKRRVYELEVQESGGELHEAYVSTIEKPAIAFISAPQIAVDNGPSSPTRGYLFVPSGQSSPGHSYAFEPVGATPVPPSVESAFASAVTEDEAALDAVIDSEGSKTTYRFQYATEADFEEEGFEGAFTAGEGTLPPSSEGVAVSAAVSNLSPHTAYAFRVIAESEGGEDEAQASFATYGPPDASSGCANQALRSGASAALPDCRAYELVTPANTGGLAPHGLNFTAFGRFLTREASPSGDALSFQIEGGTIPGMEGTGSLNGDPYLSTRGKDGWSTEVAGPNGTEASSILAGGHSPDQGYVFWEGQESGSKVIGPGLTSYLRYPDGHAELLARGSLGSDPRSVGDLIAAGGRHVIFQTTTREGIPVKLEPEAPEEGTAAIYDRTIDPASGTEQTHVVSLLPGGETPQPGQNATYRGASADGRGVAFSIGNVLYLRVDDEETYEIGELPGSTQEAFEKITFEGIAEGGKRLFYLQAGNLYAFDAETESRIPFAESGHATVVNVAADGSSAYFVSPSVLTEEESPNGQVAAEGAENLYLSREGAISFLGRVSERDVAGKFGKTEELDGLGLWAEAMQYGARLAKDPSRSTADGATLLFESRAKLTGYDPQGHAEVYRYDSEAKTLQCLSCVPTGVPASGEASLQSVKDAGDSPEPADYYSPVANLSADGRRAFFQSTEALVLADTDGAQDVYEWEEEGVGSCHTEGGCVYLISSGTSGRPTSGEPNYLYAASEDGHDVFIDTGDLLLPAQDPDTTPSIYDARVQGGFPAPPGVAGECLGEACQPAAEVPGDPVQSLNGAGNVAPKERPGTCPKGRRAVHSKGKLHCRPRHPRRKHSKTNAKGRASR